MSFIEKVSDLRVFIIGPVSTEKGEKAVLEWVRFCESVHIPVNNIAYVRSQPQRSVFNLILDAYQKIDAADVVIAVSKGDRRVPLIAEDYGTGVTYELAYAIKNKKRILCVPDAVLNDCQRRVLDELNNFVQSQQLQDTMPNNFIL